MLAAAPSAARAAPAQMAPPQMVAAQQAAMERIGDLDGVWRGAGSMIDQPGETPRQMTMTLRVGPALDGALKVIDTRGYLAAGGLGFQNFNVISFDAQKGAYTMTARAAGRGGDFSFEPTADGYVWRIGSAAAGLRYTGVIKNGVWTEVGESIAPGREPVRMSEMTVRRVSDTTWPDGGAVGPR
jgi:hypothetical protein